MFHLCFPFLLWVSKQFICPDPLKRLPMLDQYLLLKLFRHWIIFFKKLNQMLQEHISEKFYTARKIMKF